MKKTTVIGVAALSLAIVAALIMPSDSQVATALNTIHLVWTNNYEASRPNEVTILVASPDLTVPIDSWPAILMTTNAEARIPKTNWQCFFAVYNYDPDTGERSDYGSK